MRPKWRVLVTARSFATASREPIELLERNGCEVVLKPGPLSEKALSEAAHDVDAMIVGADRVSESVFTKATRLKAVSMHGVGIDQVDTEATSRRGVLVANVPGGNAQAVADLTWGMIICLARNVVDAVASTKRGEWKTYIGRSVYQKKLGIIGLGAVGKAVARRAKGFDMELLAFDPMKDKAFARQEGISYTTLEELLSGSDFVTLHVPLTGGTRGLIDATKLKRMKTTAYFVNMSRGGIVDEAALAACVRDGRIAGAATDVFSSEPPDEDNPAIQTPKIITTPHMGARTLETIHHASMQCARNVIAILTDNLDGINIVNRPQTKSG